MKILAKVTGAELVEMLREQVTDRVEAGDPVHVSRMILRRREGDVSQEITIVGGDEIELEIGGE